MSVAVLLAGVTVVRNAVVAQYAETKPQLAASIWPSHPASKLWSGLTEIGLNARVRKPVGAAILAKIRDAAVKSPLSPEPFLVRGVEAQLAGDRRVASQAFLDAKLRDGRSIPARYFLAEQYFRIGDAAHGLREIALLARMVPNGVAGLAPFIATYAKDGRNRPQLLALFRSDPQLEEAALTTLASDPGNADLVLELASSSNRQPLWAGSLLRSLVAAGQYDKAHRIWARLAHIAPSSEGLIFDPGFRGSDAPAPFNWTLTSSTVGLAERQPGGRLHVIYYGQDDGLLASQLLVLAPGRYRLAMGLAGDLTHAGSLSWTLTCAASNTQLASLRLSDPKLASSGVTFEVPASCGAQRLELIGNAPELPQQADVVVSGLNLSRMPGNG
ncbi:MAG TPA: hypothetical protein VF067_02895 [Sphingomicrobium sp.]